jgi:formylglycine-generating enzyme required for sulfatase activity
VVQGGTFDRNQDVDFPATVSDFRLDDYEITVGRFRKFVDAWGAGYRPTAGEGKHAHLNAGKGLSGAGQLYEQGWNPTWDAALPTTTAAWTADLSCSVGFPTWTANDDTKAINCLSWFAAAAFCIYDGGFLPSEAEWNYAAAGGSEQRPFPWGSASPSATLANFNCSYNSPCNGAKNISPPGVFAAGNGRYGQADLAGNVVEWVADTGNLPYLLPCVDCAELEPRPARGVRSGSFSATNAIYLRADARGFIAPQERYDGFGGRCARRAFPPE